MAGSLTPIQIRNNGLDYVNVKVNSILQKPSVFKPLLKRGNQRAFTFPILSAHTTISANTINYGEILL